MDVFAKCFEFKRDLEVQAAGLYPFFKTIEGNHGSRVIIEGREVVMAGSNNYLGLTRHPRVVEAAIEATRNFGTSCSGSRYANGTYVIHVELEEKLADYMGKEKALCFTTGYTTNMGAISVLAGRRDIILSDRENHSCIMDATQLSFAETKKYKHDDMEDLERILEASNPENGKLLVTDGVFSMKGTLAKLPRIVELKKKHGLRIFVDDAHGVGVVGKTGRGTAELRGCMDRVDVYTSTLGKALGGASGGFTSGRREIIDLLRNRSRPYLFSNTLAPPIVAGSLAALSLVSGSTALRDRLEASTRRFRAGVTAAGLRVRPGEHPIVPVMLGDARLAAEMAQRLLDLGIYVIGFSFPVVPRDQARIRVQLSAAHSDDDVDRAVEAFARVGRELGVAS